MFSFKWERTISKDLGRIKIPVAEIEIQDSHKQWKFIKLMVDSGAVISLFKKSFGELLGIDLKKGRPLKLGGIGKGKIKTYVHPINTKIGNFQLKIDAAFAENDLPPNLLGRIGIFDTLEIRFRNVTEETCFLKNR